VTRRNMALVTPDPDDNDDADEMGFVARDRAAWDTTEQVGEAVADLDRSPSDFLRFPYPSLDAITGGLAQGDIWFVAAFSGRGKTTLLTSIVDEYIAQGRTVYFMGLESKANEIRTHLACRELTRRYYDSQGREGVKVDGGDVLSGALQHLHEWAHTRRELVKAIEMQSTPEMRTRLVIDPARFVNEAGLRTSCKRASKLKSALMVIDHIDHIGGESGGAASFEESVRACNAALDAAQEYGMRMLVATQLNNQGVRADPLAGFRPPQPHHVYLGPQKRMIATGMLGLYRPMRAGLDADTMSAAKRGDADIATVLEPNTMGVVCMKNRKQGRHEGKKISLGVTHGRVHEIAEKDRYVTSYDAQGRRV
jgi:hypothetical protein